MAFSGAAFFALAAGAFFGAAFLTAAFFATGAFLAGTFFSTFLAGTFFTAFLAALNAAQRFLCAAAMRFRAAAPIFRFLAGGADFFAALAGAGFAAFFAAAQRFRCAAAIRSRDAALSLRLLGLVDGAADFPPPMPASNARACLRREISESIEERRSAMFMSNSVSRLDRRTEPG